MPDLVKFILVILAIWVVYQVFTTILFTLSQKAVAKRIKSGKMSDQQLANLYHAVARANQGSNFQVIFSYGLFYRSHAKQSDAVYELYRAEMAKRNLL
ncbi:hypothetical protein ABG980_01400 [Enterococcus casseliflavus]|uniref:hypothetical protein n=1 Tax=Enterococcus casseliflavus TaxID=37734 RepID=UPI00232E008A|nr:hypothetical protein [Enterococcus casseliflavus]MDB1697809.1 hypothetical protein [Enterococcus casseliflavus]MDB1702117.1 hypothetical protein [Enterococcus casseliflavus]MDB1704328.1 hypothetical protein [Enterococcus casseliflavus]